MTPPDLSKYSSNFAARAHRYGKKRTQKPEIPRRLKTFPNRHFPEIRPGFARSVCHQPIGSFNHYFRFREFRIVRLSPI